MSWEFLSRLLARKDLLRQVDRRGKRRPIVPHLERLEERFVFSTGVVEYTIPTAYSQPNRIVAGPPGDNDLWFTEYSGVGKIGKITTSGTITEYTVPTAYSSPYAITSGPGGDLWFTEYGADKIGKITTSGTITEYSVPTANAGPEQVAAGPDGDVWFAETWPSKIGKLDPNTGTITEYALPSAYNTPIGLSAGTDGRLWFTDAAMSGFFVGAITTAGVISEYASSSLPCFAVDEVPGPGGDVWFSTGNGSEGIGYLTPAGQGVGLPTSGPAMGIAATPDGTVYYTESNSIYSSTASGASANVVTLSGSALEGITIGPDGRVWFTDAGTNSIGVLDWTLSGGAVQTDPIQALQTPVPNQPGTTYTPGAGALQVQVPLNFMQTTQCDCGVSALTYNSASVGVQPVVQVSLASGPGDAVPTTLEARLTWNGTAGSWVTLSTSGLSSGATYSFTLQDPTAVTTTGVYPWEVDIQATLTGSMVIDRDLEGYLPVVANGSGPVGAGWTVGKADSLVPVSANGVVPAGVLYVYGTGGSRFFVSTGSGTYLSPANDQGTLASTTAGGVTTYTYTTTGLLTYTFDNAGQLLTMSAANGETNTFTYSSGLLSGITMYDGGLTTFQYSSGLLTQVDEPAGAVLLRHDGSGNLTGVTMPDNSLRSFTYDANHHLLTDVRLPLTATFAYDSTAGALTTITLANAQSVSVQPAWLTELRGTKALSGANPADTVANGLSQTSTLTLDSSGRLLAEQLPDGSSLKVTRDAEGDPTAVTDQRNNTTTYTYLYGPSGLGDLTQITYPDGSTEQFQYSSTFNEPTAAVDQNGNRTTMSYDTVGDLLTVTDALNHITTYAYYQTGGTPNGEVMSVTDPNGNIVSYAYDSARRVTEEIDGYGTALASTATMIYDAAGDLLSETTGISGTAAYAHPATTSYAYDGMGRVTEEIDGYGTAQQRETYYAYDGAGDLLSVTDPNGNVTSYAYNAAGQQTEEIDGYGTAVASTATMIYDAAGNLLSETTGQSTTAAYAHSSTTSYAYDALGRVTEEIDGYGTAVAATTTTVYDAAGNVLSVTDPNGNVVSYAYDALNRVVKEIDGYGTAVASTATMVYDAAGNLLSETTGQSTTSTYAHPSTTSYAYDALNRVVEEIDGYGTAVASTATIIYDQAGNLLSETTGQSTTAAYAHPSTTSYAYDALGRTTEEIDGYGTAVASTATMVYDAAGNLLSETTGQSTTVAYAHPSTTSYAYDALNRVVAETDGYGTAAAGTVTTVYDSDGNVLSTTDPNTNVTSYAYDALNRMTEEIDGFGTAVASTATMVYDAAGNLLSETTGQSTTVAYAHPSTTSYAYDALGRTTTEIDGYGTAVASTATMIYDQAGNLLSETTGQSTTAAYAHPSTTSYAYDALNRMTTEIDGYGAAAQRTLTTVYDAAGDVSASIDGNGNAASYSYDALGRQVSATDPFNGTATTAYDAAGNVLGTTDFDGNKTTYVYDALSRQVETINADGVTTVGYDAAGNQVSLTDPDGNKTTMAYDALGRMTGQTDPLNHTTTYAYDAGGRLTSTTDPLGRVRNITYDALNRETGETWIVSSVTTNVQTFTYDAAGDQLTAADYGGTYTNAYDALGRLISQTDPLGLSLTYTYDAASDVIQRADSLGGVLTYVYDGAGRLTSERLGGTGVTQARVDLAYDANDQVTTLTRYTDVAGTMLAGTTTYTYNAFEQLTGIFNATAAGATLSYYNYMLDSAGLVTQENWQSLNTSGGTIGGANTYTYDATDQVTDADGTAYSYDANGNPNAAGDVVNAGNELTNDGTWTYTYDAAGDMTEQSKGPGLETWYYTYDALNHLISVEQTSNGTSLTYAVTYSYDVYGHRYEEQDWATGGGVTVTYTAYDDGTAWADLTSSLTVQTRYLAGPAVNQWLAQITSGGVEWLTTDRLGSVRDVVNSAGTQVLDHTEYQAFGGVSWDTNAAAASVYEFDGERYNRSTGMLQSDGIRDVNTRTDQWDGPDPDGFGGGDPNLRRVVGNDPMNAVDVNGLSETSICIHEFEPAPYQVPNLSFTPLAGYPQLIASGGGKAIEYPGTFRLNGPATEGGFVLQHVRRVVLSDKMEVVKKELDYWEVFPVYKGATEPDWKSYLIRDSGLGLTSGYVTASGISRKDIGQYGTDDISDVFAFPELTDLKDGYSVVQSGEAFYLDGTDWQTLPGGFAAWRSTYNIDQNQGIPGFFEKPNAPSGFLPSRANSATLEKALNAFLKEHSSTASSAAWHLLQATKTPKGVTFQAWPGNMGDKEATDIIGKLKL